MPVEPSTPPPSTPEVLAEDPSLVSATEARTYLQAEGDEKPSDALLEQIIRGLSRRVLQYTGRCYINSNTEDEPTTRMFVASLDDRAVAIDDCREVTAVDVTATPDVADSWEPAGTDAWIAEPLNAPVVDRIRFYNPDLLPAQGTGWGALSLHLAGRSAWGQATTWPGQARSEITARVFVRVKARWGYGKDRDTVPANVKLAVLMWLQNIHKRDQAFFNENAEVWATIAMPKDVKDILEGETQNEAQLVVV